MVLIVTNRISEVISRFGAAFLTPLKVDFPTVITGNNFTFNTRLDAYAIASDIEGMEKLLMKIRKSASAKSTFTHFEEDEIVEAHRLVMVKKGRVSMEAVEDEQGDAKADDFINRFRQQLKLQRLDQTTNLSLHQVGDQLICS